MAFKDYSTTSTANTALGDGTYIGPNMLRNKVRPALQQLAADGKELADEFEERVNLAKGDTGPPGLTDGIFNILSFQANTVPGTTDFKAALEAAIAATSITHGDYALPGAGRILFPAGVYYFSDQVLIDKNVIIEGVDGGGPSTSAGHGTIFVAAANKGILYFRHEATSGTTSAAGSQVRNIFMIGSGASTTSSGIYSTCRVNIENVGADGFGNGIHIHGELNPADPPIGEASSFRIAGGRFTNNRNAGIKIHGGDANAFHIVGADCVANANWGIDSNSFLGGKIEACHSSLNGVVGLSGRTLHSCCTYAGKNWAVVHGQEVAASTQAPGSGSAWRSDFTTEGLPAGSPAWTTGQTWLAGGSYLVRSSSGSGNNLDSCYAESGQGPAQIFASQGYAIGGTHGSGVIGLLVEGHDGALRSSGGFKARPTIVFGSAAGNTELEWGTDDAAAYGSVAYFFHDLADERFVFSFTGATAHFGMGIQNLANAWEVTSATTTFQFGRGVAQPNKLLAPEIMLGNGTDARAVTYASGAPTTGAHAVGERVYNSAPVPGGKEGWVCTTAGTPGTWKAFGAIDA